MTLTTLALLSGVGLLALGAWKASRPAPPEPELEPPPRARLQPSSQGKPEPIVLEKRAIEVAGRKGTYERRSDGTAVTIPLREPVEPPSDGGERAEKVMTELRHTGAAISCERHALKLRWSHPFELAAARWEQVAELLPLCAEARLELSYEVDRDALELLGAGVDQPVRGLDLSLILWARSTSRSACSRLGTESSLHDGQLSVIWSGVWAQRSEVLRDFDRLGGALGMPGADPWQVFDQNLRSDRKRTLAFALRMAGPIRERAMRAIQGDPDGAYAWSLLAAHGGYSDWLVFACDSSRGLQERKPALSRLSYGSPQERCRGAMELFGDPQLRTLSCALLEGLKGPEAETAWLSMLQSTNEPEWLRQIVPALGEVGGARSMTALHELQERLGVLQFQLKDLVEAAQYVIRARSGAVAGALSLVEAPEAGALSVAAETGGLSELKDPEEP